MISGKAISKEIDFRNGAIKVNMEFTLTDGTVIKDKSVRYNFSNFSREKVTSDIKKHCEVIMQKAYNIKKNSEIVASSKIDQKVDDLKVSITECEIVVKKAEKDVDGNITSPAEAITINDSM